MLTSLKQGPHAHMGLTHNPDPQSVLLGLWNQQPVWPEREALADFGLKTLKVSPAELDKWYRLAWWGYYATKLLDYFTVTGQTDTVLSIVEQPFPFGELDSALAAGKGAILLTSHLGPGYVPSFAMGKGGYRVKTITLTKSSRPDDVSGHNIGVSSEAERKVSLIKAMKHLRSGGVLIASPTGQAGQSHMIVRFLGQQFKAYPGIAEVARLSGAPVFWASASWTNLVQLRLIIEPMDVPAPGDEKWTAHFLESYFRKLAAQMRQKPADLGFRYGFWEELQWLAPTGNVASAGRAPQ